MCKQPTLGLAAPVTPTREVTLSADTRYHTKSGVQKRTYRLLPYILGLKGPSGYSSGSKAEQVVSEWNGKGKVVLITGASTGLGLEATRVLAARGADVIMGVRDMAKAQRNADSIRKAQPDAKLTLLHLDLASFDSVREFADGVQALGKPLHVLMLNAGIMGTPYGLSKDGFEQQFATNHLGHFLLTQRLLPTLLASAKNGRQGSEGRVVVLSSCAHLSAYTEGLRVVGLDSAIGYNEWNAYGQSKLCNLLFARALAERLQGKPVKACACNPGVVDTDLSRSIPIIGQPRGIGKVIKKVLMGMCGWMMKNIPQGAATQCYCATSPEVIAGEYYQDCNLNPTHELAHSRVLGEKLWALSEQMTGTKFDITGDTMV